MAKFTLLMDQELDVKGHILHRIQYEDGKIGGWLEFEENLSQEGSCKVLHDAVVYGNAKIEENAQIYNEASVYGNALVKGNARVGQQAKVFGYATVIDESRIEGNAIVRKYAWVTGTSRVSGNATITEKAALKDSFVSGEARIAGELKLINCNISGDVELDGNEVLRDIIKDSSLSPFEKLASDLCDFMLKVEDLKSFNVRDEYSGGANNIKDYFHPMALGKANFDSKDTLSIMNLQFKPIFTIMKDWDGIIKVFRVSSSIQRWINSSEPIDSTIIINSIEEFKRYLKERLDLASKINSEILPEIIHFDELQDLLN